MNRNIVTVIILFSVALAAATYVASCHCGPPAGDGRGAGESRGATQTPQAASAPAATPEPRASASGAQGGSETVPPLGARGGEGELRSFRSALTSSVTTDSDFLTANRGYGIVEDTSVSAGNIRRSLGLPNFGLANANPTVTGWQTTTAFTGGRQLPGSVVANLYYWRNSCFWNILGRCSNSICHRLLHLHQVLLLQAVRPRLRADH